MSGNMKDSTAQQIANYFDGARFPCHRDDLISTAKGNNPDVEFLSAIESLPDRRFNSLAEVVKELVRV